ncbi:MAG TPA: hypothetical protein VGI24_03885 [Solirubrobacteraceae bacterium]|jgi:hypothetical protein
MASEHASREARQARHRRDATAIRYKPEVVALLLVAEAPPSGLDRYFYFENVPDQDSLFRHVVRAVLAIEPSRSQKARQLRRLADRGVFLIDLKPDPKLAGESLDRYVPDLVVRAVELRPRHVITIKANVCDLTQEPLRMAGLDVVDERIPFPGSGQQRRFLERMAAGLASIGWRP